jgi:hypothetical protein
MARGPDAGTLVERALHQSAARAGVSLTITDAVASRWASATFAGARHVLDVEVAGDAAAAWLGGLAEAELPMRGQLMADCVVVRRARRGDGFTAKIEALTVEIA